MFETGMLLATGADASQPSAQSGLPADNRLGLEAFMNAAVYCQEPAKVQPAKDHMHAEERLGLEAFINAVVYCEEPARVSPTASSKKETVDRYRLSAAVSNSGQGRSRTTIPSGILLGWSIIIGYLMAGGTSYFAFLASVPGALSVLLFIFLGGLLSLGLFFATHAVFGDEGIDTADAEQRAVNEAGETSRLIIEALDAIRDQPAPDPAILALKRNSLKTLLDIVEIRLDNVKKIGSQDEPEAQQLQAVRDQLRAALSLNAAQEMPHVTLGNTTTSKRRKRAA